MANSVTLTQPVSKEILNRLSRLEVMVQSLLEKIEVEPPYGSDKWWEKSMKEGEEAIEKGEYTSISTKKELDAFFQTL